MARLRVLVVEDSLTVRARICQVLRADPQIEVVGQAEDGKRAIELCRELRPDAMTMDMMLPVMTGLAATEYIMAHCPTPILIVSGSVNRGELFRTYDALAAGAVDVLEKPRGDEPDGQWEAQLCRAIKLVAKIKVITHPRGRLGALGRTGSPLPRTGEHVEPCRVVAIGTSTGGPGALLDILRAIPRPLRLPVLVVLHIDEPFGTALGEWLEAQTGHRVVAPRDGDALTLHSRHVVMAPPGRHMTMQGGRLYLGGAPPRHSCRPSVDVLFESLASDLGPAVTACLLTGMGRDGAAGLLDVRRAGGVTIAQDEATSIVYGMPREAALLGAAERVLPLGEIAREIAELAGGGAAR